MTSTTARPVDPADRDLKAAHAAMWASGDYPAIAADITLPLAPVLVDACGVTAGATVLDVASGTGNAALEAARRGAIATASDLTPQLLADGRSQAPDAVRWVEADAEDLPFDDASFDTVMSAIGVMFAPHHDRSSAELARVCRPGGRVGVLSWTPGGFIGQLFGVMKPFAAPPPPGASPAPLWGDPDHVDSLFGDRVRQDGANVDLLQVRLFAEPGSLREYFKTKYGPAIAVYARHAGDPSATAELDAGLDELAAANTAADGSMRWEYLVWTGTRR